MPEARDLLVPTEVLTPESIAGLRIVKPEDYAWIKMLVYGEPGVGKTRLAGSAVQVPEMQPVLLMDFEGGTLSLADMPDINIVRLTSWTAVDRLYGSLYDKNPYKTIIVDSLSELQKFSMSEIMRAVVTKDSDRDPDIASLREWGKNSEQVRRFVRAFRDLQCNVIFTALVSEDRDEHSGVVKTRPSLPGKLKGEVSGYVDIVLYMYKKEVRVDGSREIKVLVLTNGTERQQAKDRSGRLPELLEAPTMQTVYENIKGR
jgi:hypothetical protein